MDIPSPYEEHTGEIADPASHVAEIEHANSILYGFLSDMTANRAPTSTLQAIRDASSTLGLFAGYPTEAAYMEDFLWSPQGASYRMIATFLRGFVEEMNGLIDVRRAQSAHLGAASRSTLDGLASISRGGSAFSAAID